MGTFDPEHLVDFDALKRAAAFAAIPALRGEVTAAHDLVIKASLPGARLGMRVEVDTPGEAPVLAEVVAFDGTKVTLLPLTRHGDIRKGARVATAKVQGCIFSGRELLGRVVDCLGAPVDGGPAIEGAAPWPLHREAPDPLRRRPVDEQLATGIRALDGCLGLGLGQRIGLFSGPGLGKTTLLGMLASRAKSDVSVICLVGERGREVGEFLERSLCDEGKKRSVVVLATADAPPLSRVRALDAATSIAEWFRFEGCHALLLVDSLTRVVRAKRDVALALGEPPARNGYPPSAFFGLPALIERAGRSETGSITAIYTVLTEGRDDPVAEEARSLLDGHIVLSEKLAQRGRWPAVDILRSVSRVKESVYGPSELKAAENLRRLLGAYEEHEDLILMGAYRRGASQDTDRAIDKKNAMEAFLSQTRDERSSLEETFGMLRALLDPEPPSRSNG